MSDYLHERPHRPLVARRSRWCLDPPIEALKALEARASEDLSPLDALERAGRPSSLALTSKLPDASVLLCDLGLADALDPDGSSICWNANPYTAPELLPEDGAGAGHAGPAADLWSLGAVAHALLVGHAPCQEAPSWRGRGSHIEPRREGSSWVERSALSYDFVRGLLKEADCRPTAAAALQHPWLRGFSDVQSVRSGVGGEALVENYLHDGVSCLVSKEGSAMMALPFSSGSLTYSSLRSGAQGDPDIDVLGYGVLHGLFGNLPDPSESFGFGFKQFSRAPRPFTFEVEALFEIFENEEVGGILDVLRLLLAERLGGIGEQVFGVASCLFTLSSRTVLELGSDRFLYG
ncbi:unnamed protein product [Prorocentrum cordatum]|uniref:Protein kinase domain-containing protein n=1 Tax=Prorocentrum cordatum TaxID=2364126 RepID=A0ABN9V7I7_9DINO|nr:unnamed protein product [Polarella glacialis]